MIKQNEKYPKQCENFTFFLFCSMRITFNMHHELVLLKDLKKKKTNQSTHAYESIGNGI